ncbi:UDP-N-acetylenolpyruvoylglucosamine reductase 2 [Nitrospira sp. KM1]|uniref:UDP-N-acetylmuramate dehydrogenase n=1 Tax=Nitrospira sp. KM1 TaxID=1936990 RepID=UPI0013A7670E|nr:UDP-N-acetylmuramate dehydrogenase [Nitrospira sp. KM1]BCA55832.1 UDP-N-acetylenolpyruvoylglucosamine reductase 2 [Nitrospira sp. KM1]
MHRRVRGEDASRDRNTFRKRDLAAAVAGIKGAVSFDIGLGPYTSFRIGGPADVLVEPADIEDLVQLVRQARRQRVPIFVVGGTNLLIRDGGIRGIVVNMSALRSIKDEPGQVLYVEAGVGMPTLISYAIRRSLAGLEWAAGIPGTVGGCVVMNAGTRLGEMKQSVQAVRMVSMRGKVIDIPSSAIPFEYRRADLPKGIVAGVWLQLRQGVKADIQQVVKEYLHYRRETQPLAQPSAGCVFKNPPKDSAGRLIESAGLKGMRVGDAEVSTKHGNFIVNRGQARAADVVALIEKVRRIIRRQAGIRLDLELKIVGQR